MPVIMKDNFQYAYTTKGTVFHTLSNAEYEALTEEEKMNGDVYCIPDREPVINPDQLWEKVGTGTLDIGDDLTDGVNQLNSSLNTFKRVDITTSTASFPSTISIYGSTYYEKIGRLVVVVVNLKIESSSKTRHTITNFIPTYNDRPEYAKSFMAGDGDVDGLGQGFSIEADGRLTLYNTKTGTSYCQGTAIYISRG